MRKLSFSLIYFARGDNFPLYSLKTYQISCNKFFQKIGLVPSHLTTISPFVLRFPISFFSQFSPHLFGTCALTHLCLFFLKGISISPKRGENCLPPLLPSTLFKYLIGCLTAGCGPFSTTFYHLLYTLTFPSLFIPSSPFGV